MRELLQDALQELRTAVAAEEDERVRDHNNETHVIQVNPKP